MKTRLLIAFLFLYVTVNAQFSAGPILNFNVGNISSTNLIKNLNYQRNINPKITEWTVKGRWGVGFGAGGFVAYNFTKKFSCIVEPTIDIYNCGMDFIRVENKLDINGNGDIRTASTISDIKILAFNLPLLARYSFTESNFFVQGGVGIDFTGTPIIRSTGILQKDSYKNGLLDKTTIDPSYTLETKLNVFNSPRFNFVFGIGKSFDISGKPLTIDLRYALPLTRSEMFTTNGAYNDGVFNQNDLLGIDGKTDAERNAPYSLNDFKMSTITLSASYAIFKK